MMKTLYLDDVIKHRLGAGLGTTGSPYDAFEDALCRVYGIFAELPPDVLGEILRFARFPDSPGTLLLQNLPVDPELPPTPLDGRPVTRRASFVGEGCLIGLSQLLGEPIGYLSEKSGDLIHQVTPVKTGSYTQSNQGSKVFLNYHNDSVHDDSGYFHRYNPDFLILHCLRADRSGRAFTYYAEARDLCRALPADVVESLRRPSFRMMAPSTYTREQADGQPVWSNPIPVITGSDESPEISVAANGVEGQTKEAARALELLRATCHQDGVRGEVMLQPGQALLINNRKGLHARSAFEPSFDGTDRWLLRTYVRRSLWEMRHRATSCPRVFQ